MPTLVAFDVIEFCPVCHRPYHQLIVYVNHEAHIVLLMFEHGYRLCARSPNNNAGEGSVKPKKGTRKSRILEAKSNIERLLAASGWQFRYTLVDQKPAIDIDWVAV